MKLETTMAITVGVALIIILGGQVITYWANPYSFDSDIELEENTLEYTLNSPSTSYTIAILDNGSIFEIEDVRIYYDETYASTSRDVEKEFVRFLSNDLKLRTFNSYEENTAQDLLEMIQKDLDVNNPNEITKKAIVFVSGSLPEILYDGTSNSDLIKWLKLGGTIYWANNSLGKYYSTTPTADSPSKLVEVPNSNTLFLGGTSSAINDTGGAYGMEIVADGGFGKKLSLEYNQCIYGVNGSLIQGKSFSTGYTINDYASITFNQVADGKGMAVIFGGDLVRYDSLYVSQAIACGATYDTKVIDIQTGTKYRGTTTGTIELESPPTRFDVFIYFGNPIPMYADLYRFM